MEINIQHDPIKKRFFADVSGENCELRYKNTDDHTLDYYKTYVPESLRGKGIAGKITAIALHYALANKYKVIPSCPYVKDFIDAHPEYAQVLE